MREYSNSEIANIIDEWIHNQKYRDILKDRYINGLTYERLAEAHDISPRHAQKIVYKCSEKIFFHLNN